MHLQVAAVWRGEVIGEGENLGEVVGGWIEDALAISREDGREGLREQC